MRIENEVKLDFCDVLIRPKRSNAPSRKDVELARNYKFLNSKQEWEGIPIIASNMDTTGTFDMSKTFSDFNMEVCLHKHYPIKDLVDFYINHSQARSIYTLGIQDDDIDKLEEINNQVVQKFHEHVDWVTWFLCLDAANGYTKYFSDKVKVLREKYPKSIIMAGNVVTGDMVQELILAGADIVKVGIGPGSSCITRLVTGVGYPQLSAIYECADIAHGLGGHICADGGCTTSGDVAKAFAAGADFVMLGGILSGHDECSGEWVYEETMHGRKKIGLKFHGMSSKAAMDLYNGGVSDYRAAEGKEVVVPYKGAVKDTIQEILGGLRSACTYVGASKLKDLSKCATFIQVNRTHNQIFGG